MDIERSQIEAQRGGQLRQLFQQRAQAVDFSNHNRGILIRRLVRRRAAEPTVQQLSRPPDAGQRVFDFVRQTGDNHPQLGQMIGALGVFGQLFLVAQIVQDETQSQKPDLIVEDRRTDRPDRFQPLQATGDHPFTGG